MRGRTVGGTGLEHFLVTLPGCVSNPVSVGLQSRCVESRATLEPGPRADCANSCLHLITCMMEDRANGGLDESSMQEVARVQDIEKENMRCMQ